jgi:hypothetical protein
LLCFSPYNSIKKLFYALFLALIGGDLFPLGMESKLIPNANIAASSEFDDQVSLKHFGRLNWNGKPWCALLTDKPPFIQVDIGRLTRICAVATQGRGFDLTQVQYPTAFWVQLSNDSVNWATLLHHDNRKVCQSICIYLLSTYITYVVPFNLIYLPTSVSSYPLCVAVHLT